MNTIPTVADPDRALALHQVEIDTQIATAKQYPRDLALFKSRSLEMVTLSPEQAESCFYQLSRKQKDGTKKIIEGPSIRLAEIVMANWGNLRVGAKVLDEGSEFILVEAACHDLETNNAISVQVKRRITNSDGKRYGADMIQTTTAAAIALGMRNAIFKIIPNVFTQHFLEIAKKTAQGPQDKFQDRVAKAIKYFADLGISEDKILEKLGIKKKTQISGDHLTTLQGIATAIKDGQTTLEAEFNGKLREPQPAAQAPAPGQETTNGQAARTGDQKPAPEGPQNSSGEVALFGDEDDDADLFTRGVE
jgi:hypothetical protein